MAEIPIKSITFSDLPNNKYVIPQVDATLATAGDAADAKATGDQLTELRSAFISAMQIQGRSAKTIDRYKYILKRALGAIGVCTRQVTVYHLRQYLADEKERGIGDRTLEGYRQIFATYFNWLQREGLI